MEKSHPHLLPHLIFGLVLALGGAHVWAQPPGQTPLAADNGTHTEQIKKRLERVRTAIDVHRRHVRDLMGHTGVVASGVSLGADGEPVIRVYKDTARELGLPAFLDGVRVRSQVSGKIYALRGITCNNDSDPDNPATDGTCETFERWPTPVPIGVSVGHPAITAGTIGARVTDGNYVYILSNNHVLANINQANPGDYALQPGSYDGGTGDDAIGSLSQFEPISFCECTLFFWGLCWQESCPTNSIDAAIAMSTPEELGVSTPMGEHSSILGYGTPSTTLHPAYGDPSIIGDTDENLAALLGIEVQKVGRTTGLTTGSIATVNATVDVCYDQSCTTKARMSNQLIISPGSFSGGGDSGSLIVDMNKQPVGLLFAGSSTNTIANRIDLVLNRFGVTIDDGGSVSPVVDIAITDITVAPRSPVKGDLAQVTVTVSNTGNRPVSGEVTVALSYESTGEAIDNSHTLELPEDFGPGSSISVPTFNWTPPDSDDYTLKATLQPDDSNLENNTAYETVTVLAEPAVSPILSLWQGEARTDGWTTVNLGRDYGDNMVVVCSPSYDLSVPAPAIVRVQKAANHSFQVGLAKAVASDLDVPQFSADVHCMVVPAGVNTIGENGITIEAARLPNFSTLSSAGSWSGTQQVFPVHSFTAPVVLGQIESTDKDAPPNNCTGLFSTCVDWSVFWSHGTSVKNPPSETAIYVGRHSGEDTSNARPVETLMYIIMEAGNGTTEVFDATNGQPDERAYVAALGTDSVLGMGDSPPYTYPLTGLASANTAIVTQAAMDGGNGGWAVLYGQNPVTASVLRLAIEEDQYRDRERRHVNEQVGYIVFGDAPSPPQ